jgi:LacI family transcriptional regulator
MDRDKKSVTIKDVARRAGVAVCTASRAIANSPLVHPETRRRVFAAIEELGYRPNILARSLAKGRTNTIGVITSNIQPPFFPELIRSIEDTAYGWGFSVTISNTYDQSEKEKRYVNLFIEKRFDGLVLTHARLGEGFLLEILKGARMPFVLVNRYIRGFPADYVVSDNYRGGYLVGQHLCELGHRELACINGPEYSSASEERLQGFLAALNDYGTGIPEKLMRRGDLSSTSGYQQMRGIIQTQLPVDAVFAGNDTMAIGAINALLESGRRVPEDVSVVGFDNIEYAGLCHGVGLTTVHQSRDIMGQRAVQVLIDKIEHPETERLQQTVLPVELVVRGTTRTKAHPLEAFSGEGSGGVCEPTREDEGRMGYPRGKVKYPSRVKVS